MEAIEFTAKPFNGKIKLPDELAHLDNELKFIVLFNKVNIENVSIKESNFNSLSLSTKDNKFDRVFANER